MGKLESNKIAKTDLSAQYRHLTFLTTKGVSKTLLQKISKNAGIAKVHSICILKINMISAINWFRMNPASCLNMQPPILRSIV
mgnify:CR=1 FL=1